MRMGVLRVMSGSGRTVAGKLAVLDERLRGTKFVELTARSVLNAPESTGIGSWSINPYVGCEFGCSYCYARYAHRYVVERAHDAGRITRTQRADLGSPSGLEPFEHRIFVKARTSLLAALDRDLSRVRRRAAERGPQNILIGTATDPYQPAERQYQLTRAILDRLRLERDLNIGIITKSPLVCRDIDLLIALAGRNRVSVYVSLISMDARLTSLFEARSPLPHARLRALEKLTGAGIRAGLIVAPVLPGLTDSTEQVNDIMCAARDAGARFVHPSVLRLYPEVRERFLPIVERHFPELVERYRKRYGRGRGRDAPADYVGAIKRRFRQAGRRYGILDTENSGEQPSPKQFAALGVAQLQLL
jgi:DNA repair photolyase